MWQSHRISSYVCFRSKFQAQLSFNLVAIGQLSTLFSVDVPCFPWGLPHFRTGARCSRKNPHNLSRIRLREPIH
jgi:hypothetical protein